MKTETALTAFSMTTLLLIVTLVVMTSFEMQNAGITGNYYIGIPLQGQISRQSLPLEIPQVSIRDPFCYQNGVKDCQRLNAGQNFVFCADQVATKCGYKQFAQCFLTAGFELKYKAKRECDYGVMDECTARCSAGTVGECVEISKSRCALIGAYFQNTLMQNERSGSPSRQTSALDYRP